MAEHGEPDSLLRTYFNQLQNLYKRIGHYNLESDEVKLYDRAKLKCDKCTSLLESTNWDKPFRCISEAIKEFLLDYAQAVLDLTYIEECRLVNDDFKECDNQESSCTLQSLQEYLDTPTQIIGKVNDLSNNKLCPYEVTWLGVELLECILWRKGALMYAYCCTVYNDAERMNKECENLVKYCEDGVYFLSLMLKVRQPVHIDHLLATEHTEDDVLQLVGKGIFSDTHLLAMMYAGEMSHWWWQITQQNENNKGTTHIQRPDFDVIRKGKQVLQQYINAVKGPLKGGGWNCEKAESILKDLLS